MPELTSLIEVKTTDRLFYETMKPMLRTMNAKLAAMMMKVTRIIAVSIAVTPLRRLGNPSPSISTASTFNLTEAVESVNIMKTEPPLRILREGLKPRSCPSK